MEITLRCLQKMVAMGTGSLMLLIVRFHLGKKKKKVKEKKFEALAARLSARLPREGLFGVCV